MDELSFEYSCWADPCCDNVVRDAFLIAYLRVYWTTHRDVKLTSLSGQSNRATMRDVAALAGVSLKTVSRVVNDEPGVSPDVRERVTAAVQRLDYRPNLAASNLRRTGARTGLIGALVQDLSNSFSASLLRALEDSARRHGTSRCSRPASTRAPTVSRSSSTTWSPVGSTGCVIMPASERQDYLVSELRSGTPPSSSTGRPRRRRRLGHRRQPSRRRGWRPSTCSPRATAASRCSSTSRPSPPPRADSPGSPTPTPSAACGPTHAWS